MVIIPFLLASCSSGGGGLLSDVKLWPFGESGGRELSRTPENATEYRCEGGMRFYVRPLEGGAMWLILPEREVRLAKTGAGQTYAAGKLTLQVEGTTATVSDPPAKYSGCKVPAQAK